MTTEEARKIVSAMIAYEPDETRRELLEQLRDNCDQPDVLELFKLGIIEFAKV